MQDFLRLRHNKRANCRVKSEVVWEAESVGGGGVFSD